MTRIAVVTTIDRRSAIARATMQAAEALAELVDVTVFAEPTTQPLSCPLPLRTIDDNLIRAHDHVFTVVGDSPYHVRSFWVARRIPSIVILHDVLMAHLADASLSVDDLHSEFTRWYGPERAAVAMRGAGSQRPSWDGTNPLDAPLFEPIIESATGVIVHSTFAEARVAPTTVAPVRYLPLAYEPPWTSPPVAVRTDRGSTLLTLGNANQNKCHELVIEALADLADETVRYVIAGHISDHRREHLARLAEALGVARQVVITGVVGDTDAGRMVDSADICLNLRMPAIEGGSASLVEQMVAGKCVVVFDHGCYADAPDDCVVKLSATADGTPRLVANALRALLADPARRAEIGTRAERYARSAHSAASYARRLVDFLPEVEAAEPRNRMVRRVAATTRAWGMPHGSALAHRWGSAIEAMCAVDIRQPS